MSPVKTLSDGIVITGNCSVCNNMVSVDNKGNYNCNQCGHTDN